MKNERTAQPLHRHVDLLIGIVIALIKVFIRFWKSNLECILIIFFFVYLSRFAFPTLSDRVEDDELIECARVMQKLTCSAQDARAIMRYVSAIVTLGNNTHLYFPNVIMQL